MRMHLRSRFALAFAVVAMISGGCKSSIEKQFEAEQVVISPPLEHDPTERLQLAEWWSSGTRLLRLGESAAYALFEGNNRYAQPIERGRWSQQSYALLWLEPYNTRKVEPRRVSITKIGGRLALVLPGSEGPMFALKQPPAVLEDRVVGAWEGPLGALHLMDNLRYALSPTNDKPVAGSPQIYAMRKGSWRLADKQLVLVSDIPGVEPLRLPLTVTDKDVTINSPGGAMTKVQPQSTAAGSTPQPTEPK